jgi:hypothetical protein
MSRIGSGTIRAGGEEYFDVILNAGTRHRIYVRPEDDDVDFDLVVYDQDGNPVAVDVDESADAFCVVTPIWTGPFRIAVIAASGVGRYTLVVEDNICPQLTRKGRSNNPPGPRSRRPLHRRT